MKKNTLKILICTALSISTISGITIPTAATTLNTANEYREVFKEDNRENVSYDVLRENG